MNFEKKKERMEFTTLTYWACPIPECVSWLLRIENCWLLLWTTRVWIGPIIIINDLLHFPLPPSSPTYGHNWWTWNVFLGLYISCTDLFAKHRQSVIQINCTSGWDVMTGPTDGQDLINWGFLFPVAKLLLPSGDLWFASGVSQKPVKVVGKQKDEEDELHVFLQVIRLESGKYLVFQFLLKRKWRRSTWLFLINTRIHKKC